MTFFNYTDELTRHEEEGGQIHFEDDEIGDKFDILYKQFHEPSRFHPTATCFNSSCYEYKYLDTEMGNTAMGGVIASYNTKGYYVDFNSKATETKEKIQTLKENNWIDSFTRAVAIKWTVYNVWFDKYYSCTMLVESPEASAFYS